MTRKFQFLVESGKLKIEEINNVSVRLIKVSDTSCGIKCPMKERFLKPPQTFVKE